MAGFVVWTFILALVGILFAVSGICFAQYKNLSIPASASSVSSAAVQTA